MVKNIEYRFPKDAVDVAMAFHILGMHPLTHLSEEQREDYASKALEIFIKHYGQEKKEDIVSKSLIDTDQLRQESILLKDSCL